ncbi:DUF4297 family anti-phage-associated protein [Rossellomorea vietnamensis]|uniref:DUF4297 family anti-phage-associated protein n=1 Tax=Rossellomorea vietnamensis TaxID=218284 RepID=UPI00077CAAA9|nr:DUF4297 family anti-phage-associated protein [Rossellomorea vietnamensis]
MSKRDATDTITGYFYQFDYSILQLLRLDDLDGTVTLEGIEDVDTKTIEEEKAIQCKYYAKTEYNHSVIAKPIRMMLTHYSQYKTNVEYFLYGHFKNGHHKLELPIDIEFLKRHFLTYSKGGTKYYQHQDLNLTNEDLIQFLSKLKIDINAYDYNSQLDQIISSIKNVFNCTDFEAEHFYYNNSIKLIKDISTKQSKAERTLSKKQFLEKINTKDILFNEWFVFLKGHEQFLKRIKNEYFSSGLNTSPFERFFLIEVDESTYERNALKELILLISQRWGNTHMKRNPSPFCPYIYIHNISELELVGLKQELFLEGHFFIDGYNFFGSPFSPESLCAAPDKSNNIKIKIINKLEDIYLTLEKITKTKEVYQIYKDVPFFDLEDPSIKHIKIQLKGIKEIKEVLQ